MMTDELRKFVDKEIPVMVLLQAWSDEAVNYITDFRDGHWVVVIGYDHDKLLFEDPYSFERTFLTTTELEERWHAKEGGEKLIHHGIAVFGKDPAYDSEDVVHMD